MYNRLVKIYLCGEDCPAFNVIRSMDAPEKFSFDFIEGTLPATDTIPVGSVIIANTSGTGPYSFQNSAVCNNNTVILMGSREDIPQPISAKTPKDSKWVTRASITSPGTSVSIYSRIQRS